MSTKAPNPVDKYVGSRVRMRRIMEPPVAVADVKGDRAEIWGPVQSAGGTREDVAKTLGIPEGNVTVNVTLLGGGFGRKSKCDFALEAALLSKDMGLTVSPRSRPKAFRSPAADVSSGK